MARRIDVRRHETTVIDSAGQTDRQTDGHCNYFYTPFELHVELYTLGKFILYFSFLNYRHLAL